MSKAAVASMSEAETKTFSVSMVVSGVRCGLTYVILPFLAPLVSLYSLFLADAKLSKFLVCQDASLPIW